MRAGEEGGRGRGECSSDCFLFPLFSDCVVSKSVVRESTHRAQHRGGHGDTDNFEFPLIT